MQSVERFFLLFFIFSSRVKEWEFLFKVLAVHAHSLEMKRLLQTTVWCKKQYRFSHVHKSKKEKLRLWFVPLLYKMAVINSIVKAYSVRIMQELQPEVFIMQKHTPVHIPWWSNQWWRQSEASDTTTLWGVVRDIQLVCNFAKCNFFLVSAVRFAVQAYVRISRILVAGVRQRSWFGRKRKGSQVW